MSLFFPKDGDQPMLRLGPVVRKPVATTPLGTEVATGTPGIYEAPDGKLFTRFPENERARWAPSGKLVGKRADMVILDDIDYSNVEMRAAALSYPDWFNKMYINQPQMRAEMPGARITAMKEAHAQGYGGSQNVHDSVYGAAEVAASKMFAQIEHARLERELQRGKTHTFASPQVELQNLRRPRLARHLDVGETCSHEEVRNNLVALLPWNRYETDMNTGSVTRIS